jgi:Na+-driven multidrug efflux pump
MTTTAPAREKPRAVFTEGSILRHVLAMTATGSIGLMAIFVVDFLSLLYISWLGNPALTAGVGFASQVMFLAVSINIGMSIGVSAMTARAIGGGDRALAQRYAASGLVLSFLVATIVSALGAKDVALDAGSQFLAISLPTTNLMAVGMILAGILRAAGDARRAMYVTLLGAIVTAIVDPVLILGLHLGVAGAALTVNLSRIVWIVVGSWGVIHVHGLISYPRRAAVVRDFRPIMAIAGPAIIANLAAPVASIYGVGVMSQFGEAAVAAGSIIDRVTPVAFGALFAMSGVVGPIIGQNYGAGLMERVRSTLTNCFAFSAIYVAVTWSMLYAASPFIIWIFNAHGETARIVEFFCTWGAMAWAFLGCLFASNAAFNNLGYATFSTFFNWGRATLGFIPFVTLGARWYGPEGVIMGAVAGGMVFGLAAIACAYWLTSRLVKNSARALKMS